MPFAGRRNLNSGYDTFDHDASTSSSHEIEHHSEAQGSPLRIDVAQATLDNDDAIGMFSDMEDDVDDIPDIETDILRKSLPSAQLRTMKSVVRPGIQSINASL